MKPLPQPQHASAMPLQKAMHLANNRKRFLDATAHLRRLANEMLDVTRPFSEQDPGLFEEFKRKAIQTYDFFRKYEDAWPIRIYTRKYIKGCSKRFRLQNGGDDDMHEEGHTPENNFRRKASLPADVQNPVKGSSTQSTASNTLASSLVRSSRIRWPSLKLRDGDPDHGQSTESLASNTSPSPGCSSCSRHPSSPTITSTSSDVRSLLDFLRSVCPLLMSAAGSMVEAGIKDEMCFRALAEWPARERDTLLLDEVRLTPFQLSLVRVVLGKMRKHENVIEID